MSPEKSACSSIPANLDTPPRNRGISRSPFTPWQNAQFMALSFPAAGLPAARATVLEAEIMAAIINIELLFIMSPKSRLHIMRTGQCMAGSSLHCEPRRK
jgi:hypothetical protein